MRKLIACCALFLVFLSAAAADWPQLQHDAAHTGHTQDQVFPPYELAWAHCFPEMIYPSAQAIVARGRVYIGTFAGNLHCLELDTGRDLWSFDAGSAILHSAAWADGKVYATCHRGELVCLDAESGEELWRFSAHWPIWAAPVVEDGAVFVVSKDENIYAVDAASGQLRWQQPLGAGSVFTPAVAEGKVFVGDDQLFAHCFDAKSGEPLWKAGKFHGHGFRSYWPAVRDGRLVLTVSPVYFFTDITALIQKCIFNPVIGMQAPDAKLFDETPMFPLAMEFFDANPWAKCLYVLDTATGAEAYSAPLPYWGGGGSEMQVPALADDGYAYVVYSNMQAGSSGSAFFGRMRTSDGAMEPFLRRRAPQPAGGWQSAQAPEGEPFQKTYDFDGGFMATDQPWSVSAGGRLVYIAHDQAGDIQLSCFDTKTRQGRWLPNVSGARLSGPKRPANVLGEFKNFGTTHAVVPPVAISAPYVIVTNPWLATVFAVRGETQSEGIQ